MSAILFLKWTYMSIIYLKVKVLVMEKMTIVGKRYVNFKDDSGRVVTGWSFYYTIKAENVVGVMTGKLFVSDQKCAELDITPEVGVTYEVFYDRYGRPNKFIPA